MTDPIEMRHRKHPSSGALGAAEALSALFARIDAHAEIPAADLEAVSRVTGRTRHRIDCVPRTCEYDAGAKRS